MNNIKCYTKGKTFLILPKELKTTQQSIILQTYGTVYISQGSGNKKSEKINQLSPIYMRATCRELKQRKKNRGALSQGALIFH